MTPSLTLEWQRAWANSELGYTPSDEERALLLDAQRRPEYYLTSGRRKTAKTTSRSKPRLYRLPSTIT
jgi:hypothetical protein